MMRVPAPRRVDEAKITRRLADAGIHTGVWVEDGELVLADTDDPRAARIARRRAPRVPVHVVGGAAGGAGAFVVLKLVEVLL